MNDANALSDAVVAALQARLGSGVRSIEAHTGIFDDKELARYGANLPAVRVAVTGFGGFGRASTGECIVPMNFAAVCLAKDAQALGSPMVPRRAAVQALATAVALVVDKNRFGLASVYPPEDLRGQNQYSAKGDELGLSIWQVLWTSRVILGDGTDETLAALARLYVNAVAFSGPGANAGADPLRDDPGPP